MTRVYTHWINGADYSSNNEQIERYSPAHGALLARFTAGTAEDVDAAVASAQAVFESGVWSDLPGSERGRLLNKLADLIDRDADKLAEIEAEEVGKPFPYAKGEVLWSAQLTRFAASLAWQIPGESHTHNGPNNLVLVTQEARGVVGMIVPWNFPMVTLFQKLPYALAAGCPCVIKPSELTSGTAIEIARLAKEAGFPDGLINIVTGTGEVVGESLISHKDVTTLSFTGSTRVGKKIASAAAKDLKRAALELGGKAANIVFADADIDAALDGVLFGVILNQGEECVAGTRLIVEESIAEDFVVRLIERAKRIVVGLPANRDAQVGALIHEAHMKSVLEYIRIGQEEGATLAYGGKQLTDGELANGFFIGPTIFTNVTPEHRIFREEIFGPVLCVTTFKTTEEAVALTNDTEYGLGNGFWTKDIDKALTVSRQLKSGTVFINTFLEAVPQMPFGGYKQSGIGRENGVDALREYMEVKSTIIKTGKRTPALPTTI